MNRLQGGGALCLIAAGLVFFVAEAVTAAAWSTPPYSYAANHISDLGATVCGPHNVRQVCSPLHGVMNAAFILEGVLFLFGALALTAAQRSAPAIPYLALVALHAVGGTLVGLVPETVPPPLGSLHALGALLAIVAGNLAILVGGNTLLRPQLPAWLPPTSLGLGALGLVSFVLFVVVGRLRPEVALSIGGLIERLSAYPINGWELLVGGTLLRRLRSPRPA
jgi:hypothetical membrane protein